MFKHTRTKTYFVSVAASKRGFLAWKRKKKEKNLEDPHWPRQDIIVSRSCLGQGSQWGPWVSSFPGSFPASRPSITRKQMVGNETEPITINPRKQCSSNSPADNIREEGRPAVAWLVTNDLLRHRQTFIVHASIKTLPAPATHSPISLYQSLPP